MAMNKIKKGDTVKVIAGKDKGKEGKVIKVEDKKVLVEGIATVTKHTKASQKNPQGGITKMEAMIDSSNVMYVHKGKTSRIGFTTIEDKNGPRKVRVAKSTGEVID